MKLMNILLIFALLLACVSAVDAAGVLRLDQIKQPANTNFNMGTYKFTNLGAGVAGNDSARMSQLWLKLNKTDVVTTSSSSIVGAYSYIIYQNSTHIITKDALGNSLVGGTITKGTADDVALTIALTYASGLGGGKVHVNYGTYYHHSMVTVPQNVKLEYDLKTRIIPNANVSIFRLQYDTELSGCLIDPSPMTNTWNAVCLLVEDYPSGFVWDQTYGKDSAYIHDIWLNHYGTTAATCFGKAIFVYGHNYWPPAMHGIMNLNFDRIQIKGFEYGIYLRSGPFVNKTYVNTNKFRNIDIFETKHPIYMLSEYGTGAWMEHNTFDSIMSEYYAPVNAGIPFAWIVGVSNEFSHMSPYDWIGLAYVIAPNAGAGNARGNKISSYGGTFSDNSTEKAGNEFENINLIYRKSGSSTGTGVPQYIAHTLNAIPKIISVVPTGTGALTTLIARTNATYLNITATSGMTYNWYAEC